MTASHPSPAAPPWSDDVDPLHEVYKRLETEVPGWPASERRARMAELLATLPEAHDYQHTALGGMAMVWAQQAESGPWFEDLGQVYATRTLSPETEEAMDIGFQTGREVAMECDQPAVFAALCTPACRWDAVAHAKTLGGAARRHNVVPAIWDRLWASEHATDRPALYRRMAAYDGPFIRDVFAGLLGAYQVDPQPAPVALAHGILEALKQGDTAELTEGGWTAARLDDLCRPHVPPDVLVPVISQRWLDLGGDLDPLVTEWVDRVLCRAPRALQEEWLGRSWLTLPRTQAQVRQHDLAQQPATGRGLPRRRA